MENADHCSPDVIQRDKGEAPIGQVDKPFLVTIGRMETTVYNPTKAIPSNNKPIYCHYDGWKPLNGQNEFIKIRLHENNIRGLQQYNPLKHP